MTSPSASNPTSPASRQASRVCAIVGILLLSFLLTSCASDSAEPKESPATSMQLYQPPVLRLYQGEVIRTRDGRYIPQVDEVWHSDARYRALERELINSNAALAQERSRH